MFYYNLYDSGRLLQMLIRVTRLGQFGYFWRLIMIFLKDEVAQNNGNFWGYFLFKQIYYIFT